MMFNAFNKCFIVANIIFFLVDLSIGDILQCHRPLWCHPQAGILWCSSSRGCLNWPSNRVLASFSVTQNYL